MADTKRKPPNAGKGRRKGVPNKTTKVLRDLILQTLDDVGGADYLKMVAIHDPKTFCGLLAKVLPMQLVGLGDGPVSIVVTTGVPASPEEP